MTKASSEEVTGTETQPQQTRIKWRWPASLESYKIPILSLMLFSAFAIQSLYPGAFGFKRAKSYRFKASTLGFFVGDLTLFTNNSSEEAENRIVEVFPQKLQTKVKKVIRPVLTLCEKHNVDPFWALSVMWTESHFKFQATSKKGAKGLMQLMPETYSHLMNLMREEQIVLESDRGEDYLMTVYPETYNEIGYNGLVHKLRNLEVGIYYLRSLLNEFENNHFHATVAYNMGPSWTKDRLRNDKPVGRENHYLNKVMEAYLHITKNLSHNANVSFVSNQP
ncbi:MAG: lytic transglycosylase domain-containing protein [Bacteriovoracaceae bacterium]|nr:lytic transglycosylase domain-containing protein [Bacteriovoracaceae bacterium]